MDTTQASDAHLHEPCVHPYFWAGLSKKSSKARRAAADRRHDAWRASPEGQRWLKWNQDWTDELNRRTAEGMEPHRALDEMRGYCLVNRQETN